MNMLKTIGLLLLCCLQLSARAQEVLYSPSEKFDVRSGDFATVGKVGNKIYVYRASPEGFYLDAYNNSMERQATVVLDFFPKKIYETKFIAYNNQIIVLYQSVVSNIVIQHAALLDDRGMLVGQPIALDSAKAGFLGPNRDYFASAVSEDKKHIVVYSANTKGEKLSFRGKWINEQLQIEREVRTEYLADNDVSYGEAILGNSGVFYLPVFTPIGGRQYTDQIWLMSLTHGSSSFEKNEVPLNMKFAAGLFMRIDNINNRIYVGGFYSEKKNGNYEGVLYTYYDINSKTFQSRKNIAFDDQMRIATGERSKKRAFNDYFVRQLIVRNDGGFILVSEDYSITTRNTYSPGFGYYSMYYPTMANAVREYHYGDILVMSYNGDGVREWHQFIRKEQYSQEDGGIFSSYALMNTGGTLGFLFNDFNTSRSRIQLATVDPEGKKDTRSLAANKADDPDWLPRSGKQVSAREMVVPCLRKRQICFAKIMF